ncbi:TlpA disulfide reductase family protein [Pseudocnuella soli]|uniref:TlpA disulfide reductase family protein n=1 Tax=Pseudocnuella soli TaxID=2502779 RepID=UPI00104FBDE1|nr:TlpA disulfide reductase family protein [Pseudocnuella soli]
MKHTSLYILALLLAFAASAQTAGKKAPGFTLTAKIAGLDAPQIMLTYGGFHNSHIDTAKVVDGSFSFKGSVAEPVPAMVFTSDFKVRFDLYVDNGKIEVKGRADEPNSLIITGPAATKEFVAFNKMIMDNRGRVNDLFAKSNAARQQGDTLAAAKLETEMNRLYQHEFELRKTYIKEHPASYISAHELYAFSNVKNVKEAVVLFDALHEKIQSSSQGVALAERLNLLGRVQIGEPAISFVQQDVDGKDVSLDAYKGKWVLVEFWASWCTPCRAENPNLLNAYQQYKDKGFVILGVSLDHVRDAWIKAIQKDGMPWAQVSDLKGWKNVVAEMYGIKAIPANFLVNPEGKIVALDLRGPVLQEKLAALL